MRDFLYNKNDIIIVLLILAAAAFVIYDRMDAIMSYEPVPAAEQQVEAEAEGEANADAAADEQAADAEAADAEGAGEDSEEAKEFVSIKISDASTLSQVADTLESKGLVKSADDFVKYAEDKGKASSIITGTYKIAKGTSQKAILEAITK